MLLVTRLAAILALTACTAQADMGGPLDAYVDRALLARIHMQQIQISGTCASACAVLLSAGCVWPDARLGFHAPTNRVIGTPEWREAVSEYASYLPGDLGLWYLSKAASSRDVIWMNSRDAIGLGTRECKE